MARLEGFAQYMRRRPTRAEAALEERLLIYTEKYNLTYIAQQPFNSWIFDFYIVETGVLIEVDGSVHDSEEQHRKDMAKERDAKNRGFEVVRIRNEDVGWYNLEKLPHDVKRGFRCANELARLMRKEPFYGNTSPHRTKDKKRNGKRLRNIPVNVQDGKSSPQQYLTKRERKRLRQERRHEKRRLAAERWVARQRDAQNERERMDRFNAIIFES